MLAEPVAVNGESVDVAASAGDWPPTITGCYVLLPTKVGAGAV
jgi:hypothetical protein